jgi:hypothetical protein
VNFTTFLEAPLKKLILGLALLSATSVFADTATTKTFCMNLSSTDASTGQTLGSGQCEVGQLMSQRKLTSTWTCTFNGQAAQKLTTVAAWIADEDSEALDNDGGSVSYDIFPQEDLGAYLLKGMNMTNATDGAFLELALDGTPHAIFKNLMFSSGLGTWDYLNTDSVVIGSCAQ